MAKHTLMSAWMRTASPFAVAVAESLPQGEVRYWGQIANDPTAVEGLVKRPQKDGRECLGTYPTSSS